ncbi:hypothetical protein EDB84DRAFT_1447722 [Lactarius hengduanensis]|nr:hypothetical protein EDB84DRAFT_1447722 [Lactarius hengduanensis]
MVQDPCHHVTPPPPGPLDTLYHATCRVRPCDATSHGAEPHHARCTPWDCRPFGEPLPSLPQPPRHCQHTAPPPTRHARPLPPTHPPRRPNTACHAPPPLTPIAPDTACNIQHTPTHRHAKTQSPPTATSPQRGAQDPTDPPRPFNVARKAPATTDPPRHPDTACNTPTHRHAKTPSPPTRHVAPTQRATPRRPVTTPTPSAPPYIHAIYGTSTSLQ